MKIILVNSEQFDTVWRKLEPQRRIHADIPTPSIVIPSWDAMLVLADSVIVEDIHNRSHEITLNWLVETLDLGTKVA